ncbi:MAG: STAS domain-containing protein [Cyclobacteriaceae bacterium]|jgi:anti-sigma B factor antagonist|nr:STAS domain-containing protein [Cyclobacteriaceae bacterium]
MNFAQEIRSNTLILRIAGDLIGEDSGGRLLEAVTEAVSHKVPACIIDISELRYINSSGIGVLITILTKFRNKGGEVFLMKPSDSVKKLLVITKLNAIFQVIQHESEVIK